MKIPCLSRCTYTRATKRRKKNWKLKHGMNSSCIQEENVYWACLCGSCDMKASVKWHQNGPYDSFCVANDWSNQCNTISFNFIGSSFIIYVLLIFFISSIGWICAAGCSCCRCCFHSTGFLRRDCIVMRTSQFVYIWTCFFPLSLSVSIHLPCSLVSNFRKLLQTMFCCGMSLLPRSLMPFLFFYFVWKWLSQRMEKKFRSWH